MEFYSPLQLILDARRHYISVMPVDINKSSYENSLVLDANNNWGIRLGFREVKFFDSVNAQLIECWLDNTAFSSLDDLART